jgi:hypothetical protein
LWVPIIVASGFCRADPDVCRLDGIVLKIGACEHLRWRD